MLRLLFAAALALSGAAIAAPVLVKDEGVARISRSHQFVLRSSISGVEYRIQVSEPVRPMKPGEKAAVVYALDGNYAFGMVADIARNLPQMGEMGHAYIVAVGYPSDDQLPWDIGRERDYAHETFSFDDGKVRGGGGAAFQRFMVEELRPYIESRHPIEPGKAVLWGHSLGGLFAANVIRTQPQAFDGYIVGSPAIWIHKGFFDGMKGVAPKGGGRKVYIGVGSLETDEDMAATAQKLAEVLREPGSTFEVRDKVFPGEGHITVQGALVANGMSFILPYPKRPAAAK